MKEAVRQLTARLLALLAVLFAVGMAMDRFMPREVSPPAALASGITALGLAAALGLAKRQHAFRWTLCLVALLAGLANARVHAPALPAPQSLQPYLHRSDTLFEATIDGPPDFQPERIKIPLRLHRAILDGVGHPVDGRVNLTVKAPREQWLNGERLLARMTLKPLHSFQNPGGYDYVLAQARKGIFARAYLPDDRRMLRIIPMDTGLIEGVGTELARRIDRFRQEARRWLRERLDAHTHALYEALLLGYRHEIDPASNELLQRAGVMHLLAISGLHLGLVGFAAHWTTRWGLRLLAPGWLQFYPDRHLALLAALPAVLFYALVSGLALPTWRALIMAVFAAAATLTYRKADGFSLLGAAAVLVLLLFPESLWEASFQLSFGAVAGILWIHPKLHRVPSKDETNSWKRWIQGLLRPFVEAFKLSIAATVFIFPLLAYHFHGISPAGFIANALLVPLVGTVVLPLGLLSVALFPVLESPASWVLAAGAVSLDAVWSVISFLGRLSWSYLWVGNVPLVVIAGFYALLGIFLAPLNRRHKATAAACIAFALLIFGLLDSLSANNRFRGRLVVTAVDVGQGSSTLVQFPLGTTLLVDGGGFFDDSFDVGRHVLAPFLWHQGIRKIDVVALSHDHPDHRNGLRFILSHFKVGRYWEGPLPDTGEDPRALSPLARRRGVFEEKLTAEVPDREIDGCCVRILHPSTEYLNHRWDGRDLNRVSLVIAVDFGQTSVLIPGDIDASVEALLPQPPDSVKKTLLLAPHHGSASSSSENLLDRQRVTEAIVSCGFDNRFGFPAPAVMERFRKRGIAVHRTDQEGAIRAVSDGTVWVIEAMIGED